MDYKLMFVALACFILGRLSTLKIYVGNDREKYEAADIGILLRR